MGDLWEIRVHTTPATLTLVWFGLDRARHDPSPHLIGRLLLFQVGYQSTLPEYTPPKTKKQNLKATAGAVNLLTMGVHAAYTYVEETVKADPEGCSKKNEGFQRVPVPGARPAGSGFRVCGGFKQKGPVGCAAYRTRISS